MHPKVLRTILFIVFLLSALGLVFFIYLGFYARPIHDDFYFSTYGGSTPYFDWQFGLNGRTASALLYTLLYPIPHYLQFVPFTSILLTFAGFFSLTYALLKYYSKLKIELKLVSATIASVSTLASLLIVPSPYASFFWLAGDPPHTWSISLVMVFAGLLITRLHTKSRRLYSDILLFFVLPLFVGTLYESAALYLILISLAALLYSYRQKIPKLSPWLSTISSFACLAILLVSPGALQRRSVVQRQHHETMLSHFNGYLPDIWHTWTGILFQTMRLKSLFIVLFAFGVLLSIFYLKSRRPTPIKQTLYYSGIIIVSMFVIVSINITAIWFGMGEPLLVRSYFTPVVALVSTAIILGVLASRSINSASDWQRGMLTGGAVAAIGVIVVLHGAYIPYARNFRGQIINFSRAWDSRDKHIIQSIHDNQCKIHVQALGVYGSNYMTKNPHFWLNKEVDHYYRIDPNTNDDCGVRATRLHKFFF